MRVKCPHCQKDHDYEPPEPPRDWKEWFDRQSDLVKVAIVGAVPAVMAMLIPRC